MHKLKIIILISFALILSSLSHASTYEDSCYVINDPIEGFNRKVFAFNITVDKVFIRPIVGIYVKVVPQWTQNRVHNFFDNLTSPLTLVNNIAQGDSKGASLTVGRFLVNTFLGLGGFLDFATYFDLEQNKQTFSDTLSKYRVSYGAYLILPFMGPSTARGVIGKIGDIGINPLNYVLTKNEAISYAIASNIDLRIQYNDLIKATEESSVDYYSKVRSMYIQYISRRSVHCPINQPIDYTIDYTIDEDMLDQNTNSSEEENAKK